MSKRMIQAVLALLVVGLLAMQALSQPQGTTKRQCIEAVNLSGAKISNAQGREIRLCVQAGSTGDLGTLPLSGQLESCFAADTSNRVFRAKEKAAELEGRKCAVGLLPDYGVPQLDGGYNLGTNNY